jgi:multidrug efflux pump subunit AcrA (membrane-fusion protein)
LALLALGGAAAVWFLGRGTPPASAPVDTHVVDEGPVIVLIKEIGVVKPRQSVAVKSKVSGKVREGSSSQWSTRTPPRRSRSRRSGSRSAA